MAPGQGSVLGGYRIVRLIGRGGMGAVYLADDLRLGRKVALKVLAPETAEISAVRERFVRESQLAASLDHPHRLSRSLRASVCASKSRPATASSF